MGDPLASFFGTGNALDKINIEGWNGAETSLRGGSPATTPSTADAGNDTLDGGAGADTMAAARATTPTSSTMPATR